MVQWNPLLYHHLNFLLRNCVFIYTFFKYSSHFTDLLLIYHMLVETSIYNLLEAENDAQYCFLFQFQYLKGHIIKLFFYCDSCFYKYNIKERKAYLAATNKLFYNAHKKCSTFFIGIAWFEDLVRDLRHLNTAFLNWFHWNELTVKAFYVISLWFEENSREIQIKIDFFFKSLSISRILCRFKLIDLFASWKSTSNNGGALM
jgi:hypothetical protein